MGATSDANKNNYTRRAARFIVELTDIESPNFGNVARCAVQEMDMSEETAKSQSFKLMKKEEIRSNIEKILERRGMGKENRSQALIDIVRMGMTRSTKRYGPGRTLIEEIETPPTFSDILKAIDIMNKMDGTYTQQKEKSDMEKAEHRAILKEIMNQARRKRKNSAEPKEVEGAEIEILDEENA